MLEESDLKRGTMARADPADRQQLILYDPLSDARRGGPAPLGPEGPMTFRDPTGEPFDIPVEAARYYFQDPRARGASWNVELIDACTMACRHCYQNIRKADPWERPANPHLEGWPRLAAGLLAQRPAEVSLTGGETLLSDGLLPLLEYLTAAEGTPRCRVLLSGIALSQRKSFRALLPQLSQQGVAVKVPIYACQPLLHDWVTRAPGSLADTLVLIECLREAGVATTVSYLILGACADAAEDTIGWLRERVGGQFTVSSLIYPPRDSGRRASTGAHLMSPRQLGRLLARQPFAALPVEYISLQPRCASGCRFPTIRTSGEVLRCAVIAGSVCGNCYEDGSALGRATVGNVWDGGEAAAGPCADCFAESLCKRCVAFVSSPQPDPGYCELVRCCAKVVARRIQKALDEGYRFVHPYAAAIWLRFSEAAAPIREPSAAPE